MPQIARITATFFTNLINRLGIRPPFTSGFEISNVVQPVSLVDSDITLSAVSTTITMITPFTQGELAAPAAGTLLADTGAHSAGNYAFLILVACSNVANSSVDFRIQRRDAANAANIWTQLGATHINSAPNYQFAGTLTLSANERLRVISQNLAVGNVQASIFLQAAS